MQQIVSITSQGQITIPAAFRRLLGLNQYQKASVRTEDNKIIVESIPDINKLGGLLQNRTIKDKNIDEIIKLENKAISKAVTSKYPLKKS